MNELEEKELIKKESKQPTWLQWRGFTMRVFVVVVLSLSTLVLLISFFSFRLHQGAMRELVIKRDERAAVSAGSVLAIQLEHRGVLLEELISREFHQNISESLLKEESRRQTEFDLGLAVFSPKGDLLVSSDPTFWQDLLIATGFDPNREFSKGFLQPAFSSPIRLPDQEEHVVLVYNQPDRADNILVGGFTVRSLITRELEELFDGDDQFTLIIVSSEKNLLYSLGDGVLFEDGGIHPGIEQALNGQSGSLYFPQQGTEHLVAYTTVQPVGWALVLEEPWESVADSFLQTTQLAPFLLVPVLLVAVGALWVSLQQIVHPLQDLRSKANELAWGNYEAVEQPVGGIEEIKALQRELINLSRKVKNAQQALRGYIGAITTGQEDERSRLARELHDDTLQSLIALNQRIQLLQRASEDPLVQEQITNIQTMINQTIRSLRRLTRALRPLYLEELGLVASLKMLVQETGQNAAALFHFAILGEEYRLPDPVELAFYRIAQEGLSNIVRHANADHALVHLEFGKESVALSIEDNGIGFHVPESPAEFAPRGHYGLLGLHERAELICAELRIKSAPGEGTKLIVTMPLESWQN